MALYERVRSVQEAEVLEAMGDLKDCGVLEEEEEEDDEDEMDEDSEFEY